MAIPWRALLLTALTLASVAASPAAAQRDSSNAGANCKDALVDAGAITFSRHAGVVFSVARCRRRGEPTDGVALHLANENSYAVRYRLRLEFRAAGDSGAEEQWRSGSARGVLAAGQAKAGSANGLFWAPFAEGTGVAEIRLGAYEVTRVE